MKIMLTSLLLSMVTSVCAQKNSQNDVIISGTTTIYQLEKLKALYLAEGARFTIAEVTYDEQARLTLLRAEIHLANGHSKAYNKSFSPNDQLALLNLMDRESVPFSEIMNPRE